MSKWITPKDLQKVDEIRKKKGQRGMKLMWENDKLVGFKIISGDKYFDAIKSELEECKKKKK